MDIDEALAYLALVIALIGLGCALYSLYGPHHRWKPTPPRVAPRDSNDHNVTTSTNDTEM